MLQTWKRWKSEPYIMCCLVYFHNAYKLVLVASDYWLCFRARTFLSPPTHTGAYARWVLMHHFLYVWMDVCDVTIIHIYGMAWHMALKCYQGMEMDNLEVIPGGQGHRSKVKATRYKKRDFRSHFTGKGLTRDPQIWSRYWHGWPLGRPWRSRSKVKITRSKKRDFRLMESGYLALPCWWKLIRQTEGYVTLQWLCNIAWIVLWSLTQQ